MTWPIEQFAAWRLAELRREAEQARLAALVERQPGAISRLRNDVAVRVCAYLQRRQMVEAAAEGGAQAVPPLRNYPYGPRL